MHRLILVPRAEHSNRTLAGNEWLRSNTQQKREHNSAQQNRANKATCYMPLERPHASGTLQTTLKRFADAIKLDEQENLNCGHCQATNSEMHGLRLQATKRTCDMLVFLYKQLKQQNSTMPEVNTSTHSFNAGDRLDGSQDSGTPQLRLIRPAFMSFSDLPSS